MITVWPKSSTALAQQAEHLLGGVRVQVAGRLVGEHHRRAVDSARATATRCCWPPESSAGRCVRRSRRPTVSISCVEPRLVGLAAGQRERQRDVLLGGQHRHEVEGLEDEAEPVAAQVA